MCIHIYIYICTHDMYIIHIYMYMYTLIFGFTTLGPEAKKALPTTTAVFFLISEFGRISVRIVAFTGFG